jgi:23S rRNA pseudouridine955/2504/2580 synthase
MDIRRMIIEQDDDGQRLDRFLKKTFPTLTFGQTQKLIRTGQIRINGGRVKQDTKISMGDDLRLPPSLQNGQSKPSIQFLQKDRDFIEDIILYEDADILALNKPAGLAVQGGNKIHRHIDGLLNSYIKKNVKPRLCHRLDRDTSGVLILGKTAEATRILTAQFKSHDVQKTYWALTTPSPIDDNGTIDAPLSKSPGRHDGGEMMIHDQEHGKYAITDFEVIENAGKEIAWCAFYPKTGRTHQIRVHAQIIGAPLLGDQKYNDNPFPFEGSETYNGLHLHARSITFYHPSTNEEITIDADLPSSFLKSWKSFGFNV